MKGGNRNNIYPTDKNLPLISIIIVTYNAADVLQTCITSIINQPFKNIELLVFDGVSKDTTVDIIKANESYISYWQSEPDKGIYDAMNKAVKHASGDWILFLGADDELLEGFNEMAGKLEVKNTLYYGYCLRKNIKTGGELSAYKIAKFNVCHHAVFYPSIVFEKHSYNTNFKVCADHALNIKIWGDSKIKKQYYPYAIAKYSPDGFSTRTVDHAFKLEKLGIIKKHLNSIDYFRYALKRWKERKKPGSTFY